MEVGRNLFRYHPARARTASGVVSGESGNYDIQKGEGVSIYRLLLYLHVLLVILYLGPSLGGSFVYWRARKGRERAQILFALRSAKALYDFEHLTLLAVVASGLGLLWLGDWDPLAPGWLRQKLLLIGALLLPVEVWDVAVVNGLLSAELRKMEAAQVLTLSSRVLRAHELVLTWGGVIFSLAALGVLWLSVARG